MRKGIWLTLSLLALAGCMATAANAVQYQVVELGTLGAQHSFGTGINSDGDTVGQLHFSWDDKQGFVNSGGTMAGIGHLGQSGNTVAYDINDSGQIVGYSRDTSGANHAFLRQQNGTMLDLQTLGGTDSYAQAINNSGVVAGYSRNSSGKGRGFIWDATNGMQELSALAGGVSWATAINDSSQVAGYSYTASGGPSHAVVWNNGVMTDLNSLLTDARQSWATGINDDGWVVGYYNRYSVTGIYGFLLRGTEFVELGTLGGNCQAFGINNSGLVVGQSNNQAFVWSNGVIEQLPGLGGHTSLASSVNSQGQIVGYAYDSNFVATAVRWDPITQTAPVPEASSVLLALSGFGAIGGILRRKR